MYRNKCKGEKGGSTVVGLNYLNAMFRIRIRMGNADPDPGPGARKLTKLTNKPDFQPFKMAFVPDLRRYICFMTYYIH